jgi:hypothetical protein
MRADLSVRPLHESDYDRWSQLVADSASGSIYALPAYLETLCDATGDRFTVTGVFQGSEMVGGMPLYLQRSKMGDMAIRRPLLACHSPVIREYTTRVPSERSARQSAILAALEQHLRAVDCVHMVLVVRHTIGDIRPFQAAHWRVGPEYSYQVDITDLASTWTRVAQNLRRLVHRARDSGLVVTCDDDFDSFYQLHDEVHRRKHAALYLPEAAFRTYFVRLRAQNLCQLYHARLPNGQSVATQLVLTGPHPVSHTVCAASDGAYLALGTNPFLRWKVFEALAALGYTANDLTGATYGHDVTLFKRQLGGELVANWYIVRPETFRYRLRRKADPAVRFIKSAVHLLRHGA